MRERAQTSALAFAIEHMRTEDGRRLDYVSRPYLPAILLDDRKEQVLVSCAQAGKTVVFLCKLYFLLVSQRGLRVIYTFPTFDEVYAFANDRGKKMLLASPLLRQEIGDLETVTRTSFKNGSTMIFKGTFTERAALSDPAHIVVIDELDRSDPKTVQMFSDRLRAAKDPRTYKFSTPTTPGFGISKEWERSDQQEWEWDCPECGKAQVFAPMDASIDWQDQLDLSEVKYERDAHKARFRCFACRAEIPRSTILAGRWVAQVPENAGVAGYHITGIMPPEATAERLAAEKIKGDHTERFVQGHIGLPYAGGDYALTPDMIRFGDWENTLALPRDSRRSGGVSETVAGLDPGGVHDFVAGDGKGRIMAVHRFSDWKQVHSAMTTLNVRLLVVDGDSAYGQSECQKLVAAFPGRVWLANYPNTNVPWETWFKPIKDTVRVQIDRTAGLDTGMERIIMDDTWPLCEPDLTQEIKSQLCAPKRTIEEDAKKRPKSVWRHTQPDHFRHAHLYYTVASKLVRPVGDISEAVVDIPTIASQWPERW